LQSSIDWRFASDIVIYKEGCSVTQIRDKSYLDGNVITLTTPLSSRVLGCPSYLSL
jgi:hypothetical protein